MKKREIKFRVKIKNNEELVTVCSIDWGNKYITYDIGTEIVEVDFRDVEHLMQYTGFKDPNSKEDYHKDICEYLDDSNIKQLGIIKWSDGAWWLIAINGDDEGNQDVMLAHAEGHVNLGNIYENPELLEMKNLHIKT